jgi:vacuolar protein sorting-associated protein 13A/C
MPVLLAPDQTSDVQHPVFKMTITMQNENKDEVQVYPYVYIRVCSMSLMLRFYLIYLIFFGNINFKYLDSTVL